MNFKIIISLSEVLVSYPEKLKKINSFGDCIYRLNGSHFKINNLLFIVMSLRNILKNPKIMLDLPGNKVRMNGLSEPIRLNKGEIFELHDYLVNYPQFYTHLKPGDSVSTNDSTFILEVKQIEGTTIKLMSHSDGLLQNNRGLHVRGVYECIPFISQKDIELIKVACKENFDYLSLSYVRTAEDIKQIKKLLTDHKKNNIQIIAKIETASAVENLKHIFNEVDHISIDRGDLSAEIGMLKLPAVQDRIIKAAKRAKKNIYLATQFLKNMEYNPVPLIAEVVDLHRTIKTGISGIQLSEETAIGKYPVECVKLVCDIYKNLLLEV